jgi:hypothetical protein
MTRNQALKKAQACLEKAEENIGYKGYESWSLLADRYMVLANEISRESLNSVGTV